MSAKKMPTNIRGLKEEVAACAARALDGLSMETQDTILGSVRLEIEIDIYIKSSKRISTILRFRGDHETAN